MELEDEDLERLGFLEDLRKGGRENVYSGEITTGEREFARELRSRRN